MSNLLTEENEDEQISYKKSTGQTIISYWWLILAIAFVILFRGRIGLISADTATTYFIGFIFVVFFMKMTWTEFKHRTPKLIYNPYFSTTDGTFSSVGNYGIFRLGSIKAMGIYVPGNEGALVCPIQSINKIGSSVATTCRVELVRLDELPPETASVITQYNIPAPYLLGFADEEQILNRPEIQTVINELKQRNKENKMLIDVLNGKLGTIENTVAGASRIHDRASGGLSQKIKDAFGEGD